MTPAPRLAQAFIEEPEGTVSETNVSWAIDWENRTITGGDEELIREFAADHGFPEEGLPGLPPGQGWTLYPDPSFERALPAPAAAAAELPAPRPEGGTGGGGDAAGAIEPLGDVGGVQFAADSGVEVLGVSSSDGILPIPVLYTPPAAHPWPLARTMSTSGLRPSNPKP